MRFSLVVAVSLACVSGMGLEPIMFRSNPWEVSTRSGAFGRKRTKRRARFFASGVVEFEDGERGLWQCENDCVQWTTRGADVVHYHANLHHSEFFPAARPKLLCGVVTRDRRSKTWKTLFRPVVASFEARGRRTKLPERDVYIHYNWRSFFLAARRDIQRRPPRGGGGDDGGRLHSIAPGWVLEE